MSPHPDDWLDGLPGPANRPRVYQPPAAADRPVNLASSLARLGKAAENWNKPAVYRAFEPGRHVVICTRSEWHTPKSGGEPYLLMVWADHTQKRGRTIADYLHLNAGTLKGREFALRRLALVASAAGIELDAEAFRPGSLLGACVAITVANRADWRDSQKLLPGITRFEPAPEV
jgi:hypothetical protein